MRKIVNLHLEGGQTIPGECWATHTPGLIVTQGVTTHRILTDEYCVTHETSGMRIGDPLWPSVELAQIFAERVKTLADWTHDAETLTNQFAPGLAEQIDSIAHELQAEADKNPADVLGVSGGDLT